MCGCSLDKRIHPREIKFLLDQRSERIMGIGPVDSAVSAENQRLAMNRRTSPHSTISRCDSDTVAVPPDESPSDPDNGSSGNSDPDFLGQDEPTASINLSSELCKITDRRSVSVRSVSEIMNETASALQSSSQVSYSTVYRKKIKLREQSLEDSMAVLRNNKIQLAFDGKQLFRRERLAGLAISQAGSYFSALKTFRIREKCSAEACANFLIKSVPEPVNLLSLMADTCSLNTGEKNRIFRQIEAHYKRNIGEDILALECQFHVNELLLKNVMRYYDGPTTSPTALQKSSVHGFIKNISSSQLKKNNLMSFNICDIKPTLQAQNILSNVVDSIPESKVTGTKLVRDDQASLLALSCATFRNLEGTTYEKYLYYSQEQLSLARWITTASGYLRLFLFSIGDLDADQQNVLRNIVQFIISVYAPNFFNVFLNPSAVSGPDNMIQLRNLMHSAKDVSLAAKQCFIKHAKKWLNTKTVPLCLFDKHPPNINLLRLASNEPDMEQLLWSNRPISAFFCAASCSSPVLTRGTKEDWISFRNNNLGCERLIGQLKLCVVDKKVKDSDDEQSDELLASTDERIRGFVNHAYYS